MITNELLQIKIKQRANKLDSLDYDNIECWQISEAFNKVQYEWVRRQVEGLNQKQIGDEATKNKIDDIQNLLVETSMDVIKQDLFFETELLPDNYGFFKRVYAYCEVECCPPRLLKIHLEKEADINELLEDEHKKPSAEWGETFVTIFGNKLRIYTNNEFDIADTKLIYYRLPRRIEILGCMNENTGEIITEDVTCEFKEDIVEILCDLTASVLSGDIELFNQHQRNAGNAQINT